MRRPPSCAARPSARGAPCRRSCGWRFRIASPTTSTPSGYGWLLAGWRRNTARSSTASGTPDPILMEHLTVEDLLTVADEVIGTPAVRDIGLLDSAAHRPQASAFGKEAYPTIYEKAAALLEAVVRN